MNDQSPEYFKRRAEQERAAADQARDERAATAHRELAEHFDRLAQSGEERQAEVEAQPERTLSSDFRIIP